MSLSYYSCQRVEVNPVTANFWRCYQIYNNGLSSVLKLLGIWVSFCKSAYFFVVGQLCSVTLQIGYSPDQDCPQCVSQ